MLEEIDVLLFDMQDVGARFYTYNSTMKYVIEAAAEQGIEVWILDRPNPLGGDYVAGWVWGEYNSFVGTYPIPIARWINFGWISSNGIGGGLVRNRCQRSASHTNEWLAARDEMEWHPIRMGATIA